VRVRTLSVRGHVSRGPRNDQQRAYAVKDGRTEQTVHNACGTISQTGLAARQRSVRTAGDQEAITRRDLTPASRADGR
jgi:hypothetical protein